MCFWRVARYWRSRQLVARGRATPPARDVLARFFDRTLPKVPKDVCFWRVALLLVLLAQGIATRAARTCVSSLCPAGTNSRAAGPSHNNNSITSTPT